MSVFTLEEIAKHCDAKLVGKRNEKITGVAPLDEANVGHVSFLGNDKYKRLLPECTASAVIVKQEDAEQCNTAALVVENPELSFIQVAELFLRNIELPKAVHPSAVVGKNCKLHKSVAVGANVVIGDRVSIGANTQILPGTVVGDDSVIGDDCLLYANVTLYPQVRIGDRVIIHSGAVLGADGFGMAQDDGRWRKIPQLGTVVVGDDVEIGANTCIDCGALGNTIIGNGVKLDNLIQIAHNVKLGDNTAIASQTGVAGSTKIGNNCMIAGQAGILGHLKIADGTMITPSTSVSRSITKPGIYSSGLPHDDLRSWRRNMLRFLKLNEMYRSIKKLEKEVFHECD